MPWEKHCWAEVNLDALEHNYHMICRHTGGRVCAVVKADAYGHGSVAVARALQGAGASAFAVSCLAEARELRHHGIRAPLLILGYTDPAFAGELAALGITQTILDTAYARALSAQAAAAGCTVACHLKADTGMGRIGFSLRGDFEEAICQMEGCYALPGLCITGVFQHFAAADGLDSQDVAYTDAQYTLFWRAVSRLQKDGFAPGTVHCANSAAQLLHPEWRCHMVRAGIILYGYTPGTELNFPALQPVLTLKALVTQVKTVAPGESLSYGCTFTAQAPIRVATVCVGYGDGYPRALSNSGCMALHKKCAPVVGRICMDQTLLDVTAIPGVQPGDEVTVFGSGTSGEDTARTIADKTGTIPYEILCGLARRVPRVYLRNGMAVTIRDALG